MIQRRLKLLTEEEAGILKPSTQVSGPKKKFKSKKPLNSRPQWTMYEIGNDFLIPENKVLLIQTYNKHNNLRAPPSIRGAKSAVATELSDILIQQDPIGYTEYHGSFQKSGSITTYLAVANQSDIVKIARYAGKRVDLRKLSQRILDNDQDIAYNIFSRHIKFSKVSIPRTNLDLESAFTQVIRDDILRFCSLSKPKLKSNQIGFVEVKSLLNQHVSTISFIPAKNDMVLKGKGEYDNHEICSINLGLDDGTGCNAGTTPEGFYAPDKRCSYCYAQQNGGDALKTKFQFTKESLMDDIKKKARELGFNDTQALVIRLGQRVEMNTPRILRENLGIENRLDEILLTLENLSKERPIHTILPTKVPDFSQKTIDLLKRANASVLASIAYEVLEPGLIDFGYTDDRRLEYARILALEGVNTNVYLTTDIGRSMKSMQPGGHKALEFVDKYSKSLGIGIQYLEARITRRQDAVVIGGAPWYKLLNSTNRNLLEQEQLGEWAKTGQGYLYPVKIHPDFLQKVGNERDYHRFCRVSGPNKQGDPNGHKCGNCFIDKPYKPHLSPNMEHKNRGYISLQSI